MWKINCWLASLSVTDTQFNSAVLRQQHVPACPALPSWHFPLVPLKSAFIVPRPWREEQKDARAVGRVAVARQGGAGSPLLLAMPHPQGPPAPIWGAALEQFHAHGEFHVPADAESLSLWPPGAPGTISCSLASTKAQTLSK